MITLNGFSIPTGTFPNGESSFDGEFIRGCMRDITYGHLGMCFESDADLMELWFVKRHLDSLGITRVDLSMPYLPYSRMDRSEAGSLFTLKSVCELINSLGFRKVAISDVHSDVGLALLDRCENTSNLDKLLYNAEQDGEYNHKQDYLLFPDAGAQKRYGKQFGGCKQLVAFKNRDFKTGHIKELQVYGEIPETGFNVAIVDDLCSRGGTFILAAQQLKKLGANKIILVVGHCENTIHNGEILNSDLISKVYTTNSILSVPHPKISILTVIERGNI